MVRVYADMVADLFHFGHVEFLRQARALGDTLVVGVHSDRDVAAYKRPPIMSMEERVAMVRACASVGEVIPAAPLPVTAEFLDLHGIDLVVHGDYFDAAALAQYYAVPIERGMLRTVRYNPSISTSEIIRRVLAAGPEGGDTGVSRD